MATFNPRRFAQPEILRAIEPGRLRQFLSPYRDFLDGLGAGMLRCGDRALDYESLARALMSLGEDAPMELMDSLHLIDEMATTSNMDRLLLAIQKKRLPIEISPKATPADVAVQVFLEDRELIEEQHAVGFVNRARSFYAYCGSEKWQGPFAIPSEGVLRALERDLDDWFDTKKRGRGCRVMMFDRGNRVDFVVRHGKVYKRDSAVKRGESTSVFYRPGCHDLLVYDPIHNELSVRAETPQERAKYAELLGQHLFDNPDHFCVSEKYSLTPLLEGDRSVLTCSDMDGLDWVKLCHVTFQEPGEMEDVEEKRGKDLFESFARKGYEFPEGSHLLTAKFEVMFENSRKPRALTISNTHKASFTRDSDSTILEEWMHRRGFMRRAEEEGYHAQLAKALVPA
ncbi:conserved hypothetical protein [Magnetococcus marinus MC-1]|uniref:Uncharacterized protein n=1 Tax=Magnetococcus marinus (strain ATCC BAA-1437 / JCM 17883 / MC-1) TaxID=156889 RepID=A0L9E1_MAGMM|nr:hypothetical protein [Magnetococcus marinus]ABK44584.1 conserved hypothetical protein [Magnetococcus marinus MC-1]